MSGVVNRVAIWFYYRKAFATAFVVLSRAQFWLSRRHFFRNIFRGGFRGAFARTVLAFAAWNWCTPFAELSRGFRAWRFCFRGRFLTWTRILNPFMEVFWCCSNGNPLYSTTNQSEQDWLVSWSENDRKVEETWPPKKRVDLNQQEIWINWGDKQE